jgi:hypothetical protein
LNIREREYRCLCSYYVIKDLKDLGLAYVFAIIHVLLYLQLTYRTVAITDISSYEWQPKETAVNRIGRYLRLIQYYSFELCLPISQIVV